MRGDLETRLVAALTGDLAAAKLAALIAETEAEIAQAETLATEARQRALDPVASPDLRQARATMEDAAFRCDRLKSLLPRLQSRYEKVAAAEERTRWEAKYRALKVQRDGLAAELSETYPLLASKLGALFARIAANDAELANLHQSRPSGVPLHLAGAELTARRLNGFSTICPSIAEGLRIPDWQNSGRMVWPPPSVPLAVLATAVMSAPSSTGPDWWTGREKRAVALRAEGERVARFNADRERQREEQQADGKPESF